MQVRRGAERCDIGVAGEIVGGVEAVKMQRRGDHLIALQALEPAHRAFVERGEPGARFPQAPFQEAVLAAADDWRWLGGQHAGRARQAR